LSLTGALFASQPSRWQRLNHLFSSAPHGPMEGTASAALALADVSPLLEGLPIETLPPDIRRSVPARRLAFAAGRLCAEHAMQALQGRAQYVARGESGESIWPIGLDGSITHTSTIAAAVVGRKAGRFSLGIDSEVCVSEAGLCDILKVCCTEGERRRLFGGLNDRRVATILFSAKGSLFKAIHCAVQRFVDFDEAEVECIDWARQRLRLVANGAKPQAGQIPACFADFRIHGDLVHTSVRPG
jgi:enterobactin synthetase component D